MTDLRSKFQRRAIVLLTTFLLALTLAGCGGDGGGSGSSSGGGDTQTPPADQQASISGTVTEYATGEALDGARVAIVDPSSGNVLGQGTTDSTGAYEIANLGFDDRLVVTAIATGYAPQSEIIATSASSASPDVDIALQNADVEQTFDPAAAETILSANGIDLVELSANAFETADGDAPVGNVSAVVEIVDPSGDPTVLPGNYEAVGTPGNDVPGQDNPTFMESYGAVVFLFVDEAGNVLNLAPGESATIRIPVAADRANPPATIPLFFFDPTTGIWQEAEGNTAQLVTIGGEQIYEATVQHFSSWNADYLYESVYVNGCVVDQNGDPLANALIRSQGLSYIGASSVRTDAQGNFSIPVKPASSSDDSRLLLASIAGGLSATQEVTLTQADGETGKTLTDCLRANPGAAKITLTWGQNPSDLDSHLCFADPAGTDTYHIYFSNQIVTVNGALISLDHDDVTSFGPEITTIGSYPFVPGTYRFLVHKYSGSGTIESSPARVEVELGDQDRVFAPTNAQGTVSLVWHVFNVLVDDQGNPTIVPVQQWLNSTDAGAVCDAASQSTTVNMRAHRSARVAPEKQYAR